MKKLSTLPLLLFAFAVSAQQTVFSDLFYSNSNNWLQSTSGGGIYVINNGKLIMENTDDGSRWVGRPVTLSSSKNFSISATTSHTGGIDNYGYGIIFGAIDGKNGYAFEISANGYYTLLKFENGNSTKIVEWTTSTSIKKGNYVSNELMIKKEYGYWKLYVNDSYLTQVTERSFVGNYIGFITYKNQRVEYDNLYVKEWDAPSYSNTTSTTAKELFFDDFVSNAKSWGTSNTSDYTSAVNNGKYIIDISNKDKTYASFRTISVDDEKDYSVSMTTTHTGGVENYNYGVIFGLNDLNNCYRFGITANGYYILYKYDNSQYSKLIEYKQNSNIRTGNYATNEIEVRKVGSNWHFYVNNQWVVSYDAQDFFASKFGMYVTNAQRVEFDNFKVSGSGASSTTSTTTTIPDYSGGSKLSESGTFCNLFNKITNEGSDRFRKLTGPEIDQTKYVRNHQSTFKVTDANKAYVSQGSTYATFKIDFGEYNSSNEAINRIEQVIPMIEKCLGYKVVKSDGGFWTSSQYYLTKKTATGIINTGYYLNYASSTNGSLTTYTATLNIPDKPYANTYTYLTNTTDNSTLASQLKTLLNYSENGFEAIKGSKKGGDDSYLYNTSYKPSGASDAELEDIFGVLDYYAYYGKSISLESTARQKYLSLAESVKKALGKGYMFTTSKGTYSDMYYFYPKDDFSGYTDLIEVEMYSNSDGTYDVRLIVVGTDDYF